MERIKDLVISPQTGEDLVYLKENNKKGFGTRDKGIVYSYVDGVIDLVDPDSDKKHKKIGKAYDQSLFMYDDYMEGRKLRWRLLKYILLGYGYDDVKECERTADRLFERVQKGIVLEVPIGTGINTIKKYAAYPDILFVAADYSWGMLQESKRKIDELGLKNVVLARVDVAKLPFKDEVFDGLLTLNGIHSFPEKEKGMEQMSRVLKKGKALFGSLVVKKERWLTDVMMELFYFPGKWFCRPALTKEEFARLLEKNKLESKDQKLISALVSFASLKRSI